MEDASLRKLGKSALTAVIAAERKVLEAAGYQVGVYCNQDWYSNVLDVDKLDLPFWIARYGSNNGKQQTKPSVKSRHTLWGWQYSSVGRVSGISGSVDVNVAYFAPGSFGGSKTYTRPMVRQGDRGDAVKQLQTLLSFCGWTLAMDGIWGVKTDSAVKGYQYKAGLTVDGIVGPKTWAKLFQDAIVARAKEIAEYMVKHKWRYKGGGYVAKSTFAATKKLDKPGCSCAHFVSWVLQDVGLLKPGDVLVHDSSIGIYDPIGGTPAILTAREGQPINGKKQYTDLLVSSGYEWKRDVLAVVRAKVQMARCRTMPNDLH